MSYEIIRSDEEIDKVVNKCTEIADSGENPYWGMTFSEGVLQAIDWLTKEGFDHPFGDE